MRCLDATFLVDYSRGKPAAVERVRELTEMGEDLATPAVAMTEVLIGANYRGGRQLARTLEFLESLAVLPFDITVAAEAGRMGADALRRGSPIRGHDLLVAATARHHRAILVTRDGVFAGVSGLAVESY